MEMQKVQTFKFVYSFCVSPKQNTIFSNLKLYIPSIWEKKHATLNKQGWQDCEVVSLVSVEFLY